MTNEVKMENKFERTALLFGEDGMKRLQNAHVAVFGVGGVGGYAVEALARSGIGKIDIFDDDTVSVTNINRQIIATTKTVGQYKVDVMKERILSINPDAQVNAYRCFYMPDNSSEYDFGAYTYIVDAIDTVTGKIEIIMKANEKNVPVISVMGAGNKLDPTQFEVADIYKTTVCPLARTMRREMKKRGVKKLKVVYSKEEPAIKGIANDESDEISQRGGNPKKVVPASNAFVPAVAGLVAAGEVIKDIAKGVDSGGK